MRNLLILSIGLALLSFRTEGAILKSEYATPKETTEPPKTPSGTLN